MKGWPDEGLRPLAEYIDSLHTPNSPRLPEAAKVKHDEGYCEIPSPADEALTHRLKSPCLIGLWTMRRFLHNGALDSLDELFGMTAEAVLHHKGDAMDTSGHTMTCARPSTDEKRALNAYLLAHSRR